MSKGLRPECGNFTPIGAGGQWYKFRLFMDKNYTLKKVIVFAIPNMDSYISERLNFGGLKSISSGSLNSAGKNQ